MGLEQQPSVMEELSIKTAKPQAWGKAKNQCENIVAALVEEQLDSNRQTTPQKHAAKNAEKPRKCLLFSRFYGII